MMLCRLLLTPSIFFAQPCWSNEKILKHTDNAMYDVKPNGRDSICAFTEKP